MALAAFVKKHSWIIPMIGCALLILVGVLWS